MSTHSSRRTTLTLTLACLFLLLLSFIGWMEFGNSKPLAQAKVNIKTIIIKRAGHEDITLVRTGAIWNMTTPYKLVANTQRIDPLLSLGSATFDGYDKAEVDMPATGLNNPGASITIGTREFLLGETDANGERRYTLVDDKVSFVPGWVWSLVHGGVTAFSDLTVFGQLPDDLYLVKGGDVAKLTNVEQWKVLQADTISAWQNDPAQLIEDRAPQGGVDPAVWLLSSTDDPNLVEPLATLLRLKDRTLLNTRPGFAYAISNARLDALLNQ